MERPSKHQAIPFWQRAICAAIFIGGIPGVIVIAFLALHEDDYKAAIPLLTSSFGLLLFGFAAFKGELPKFMQSSSGRKQP